MANPNRVIPRRGETMEEAEARTARVREERQRYIESKTAMREELSARFPTFFGDAGPMDFDPGWRKLMIELAERCIAAEPDSKFRWGKEKFGTLRIHVYGTDSLLSGIVGEIEGRSGHTCERCGEPGHKDQYGMLVATRCLEHGLEMARERGSDEMIAVWESRALAAAAAPQDDDDDEDGGLRL